MIEHPLGQVRVCVVEILGDRVRLGIEADNAIAVHRDEVAAAILKGRVAEVRNHLDWEENHTT